MTAVPTNFPTPVDLTTCDREPIHIPGSIQPHGYLLVLREPDLTVLQVSENVGPLVGRDAASLLGRPVEQVLPGELTGALRNLRASTAIERNPVYLSTVTLPNGGQTFRALAHRIDGALVLELEPDPSAGQALYHDLFPMVRTFVARLAGVRGVDELNQLAAVEVRRLTGFDRVLVYQFDESWNGHVVAEDRDPAVYDSFLDLRFPASDIPAQARELYRLNRLRLIVDASYKPVPILPAHNPLTGRPLDLSYAALRSVSPIHCEYLRNMGLAASMSISILRDGRLWGLISCHHATPRVVPFEVRTACDLVGQVISLQLQAREHQADTQRRIDLKVTQGQLLAYMAMEPHFVRGLINHPLELLKLTDARGAAVVFEEQVHCIGSCPPEDFCRRLTDWLAETVNREVYATDALPAVLPEAKGYADSAAGLLAVSISKLHRSYVVWFRPEVVREVKWSGDPRKPAEPLPGDVRLHPRKSFETWKETVRGRSVPWHSAEVDAAADLRNSVVGIVLRKAEEMAELSGELERSNKELEAFSYSVSHDLRAPFRHIVGYSELLKEREGPKLSGDGRRYIETIIESAQYAGTLVDNLLTFSQMGRSALHMTEFDTDALVREIVGQMTDPAQKLGRRIRWEIGRLPRVTADVSMLRLAFQNLIENAVKYTRPRPEAVIAVGAERGERETTFFVRDNGVGFDMQYADKLFGVFQRLHKMEDFEGTGIGLANVRRIVARHGGRTWADAAPDKGATFFFSLPNQPPVTAAET